LITNITSVGKSPHAVVLHPKDRNRAYSLNIGPRAADAQGNPDAGETITELVHQDGAWKIGKRLDLTAERALADTAKFPSRRPVLAGFSQSGRYLAVSFLTGGLAVVDIESWRVTKALGNDQVRQNVTAVVPSPDGRELYVAAGNQNESWLYVLDAVNEPSLVASHDLSSFGKDAHSIAMDTQRGELWLVHRVSSNITIHPLQDIRQSGQQPAVMPVGGKTPDFIALSPDGQRAFVTLRGPQPAPTIPFPLVGETPGVAVLDVPNRRVSKVVPLGDPQTSDFHGVAIVSSP
jgi:DNA-binding beta-propeller fold protein YncE